MAGIITNVDSDVQKLRKLKNEIEEVKKALKGINIKVDVDIAKGMEAQLKSLTDQYNALVTKVAEAEGKILLSTKRINDASEKIIKAQENLSKVTGVTAQPVSPNMTSSNASETASIQLQAKAYDELRDEIDSVIGTRSQNIKRMIEESNAIRLINAEIKKITKSQGESSTLSSAQQRRLEQLNNSLLTHKTALSEVRQNLSNNVKLDNVAATSMNGLSQSLSRMRMTYRELTEEERKSPFGKELLASINQADIKIKELDSTIGNHQRNVGNYGKQWNGLSISIQQVGRELPSLAYGPKVFFSAISNNLPILADEIKRARIEYDLLKKSGQSATPVWKQIISSLFSWQTALTIGITLLTLYGDKVVVWVTSLIKAKNTIKEMLSAEHEMALARKNAVSNSIKERTELDFLYKKLRDTTLSTKERNAAVNEWMKKHPQHSNIMNGEIISLGKLESAYQLLSKQIVETAKARAYSDKITELTKEREEAETRRLNSLNTLERSKAALAKNGSDLQKTITKNAQKQYDAIAQEVEQYDKKIAQIQKKIKVDDLFPQPHEGTYDYWQQQVQIADTSLKQIKEEYLKVLKSGNKEKINLIPEDVKNQYNKAIALKTRAEKALSVYDTSSKQESENENQKKTQEKYSLLLDKQRLDRQRQSEDIEYQLAQTTIDAMGDGFDKVQAQRELDNKKEIQALKRQKEDYIRTIIQAEKEKFDVQEELNAKQTKDYKKKTFNPATITVDTSSFDNIIDNTSRGQLNERIRNQEESWNEYLIKYGTFQQKKDAITRKYTNAINKAATAGEAASLQKEWEESLSNLDLSKLKEEINWEMIFGDLSKVTKDQLTKIKKQLQEFKKSSKFQNATPEQIQVIEGAINSINDAMVDKGGFFGGMTDSVKELKIATEELKRAEEELAEANKKGTEAEKEEAQKKVNQAKNRQQNAQTNVEKSSDKAIQHLTAVGDAISQLGSSAEMSLSSFGNAAANIVDAFSEAGSKIGGIIGAIFSILEGIQKQGLDGFVGNIIGNVADAVGGILDTLTFGVFGLKGADYSEYNEMVAKYDSLLDVWDQLLDKKKAYIKESYGPEATKVGQEALDLLNSEREITKELASSRLDAGKSAGSHSMNYRMWKGSYDYNGQKWKDVAPEISNALGGVDFSSMWSMLNMSSEQLEWIKTNYSGLWAHMDGDFKGYLENIIQYGDTEKEIIESINEQLTQTSFDSLFDGFLNTLMDMDASSKDFADNFEEYMRKAIFTSMFAKNYEGALEEWHKAFAKANDKEGGITAGDVKDLKNQWDDIVNGALADREAWEKIVGSSSESTSQSSTSKGFTAMSQDTGEELNGRFTALQIAGEEIKNQNALQTQSLNILTVKADAILSVNTDTRNIADEIRTIQVNSYLELQEIRENTGAIVKPIQQIQKDIAEVKKNTKGLS